MSTYNRAVVDVYCLGDGTVNEANEVAENDVKKFRNVGGRLRALSGRELERALQIRADIKWVYECSQPGIEVDDWICQPGRNRKLNVAAVIPDEREINFKLFCSERVL